jgi:hypothetical protein
MAAQNDIGKNIASELLSPHTLWSALSFKWLDKKSGKAIFPTP